jgi:ABC-type multidrug transport system ATPase subunit
MGFLSPSAGRITIDGESPRRWVERHGVGYLTELVNLPPRWKVPSTLRRMAALSGVPRHEVAGQAAAMMSLLGLDEHAAKRIKQLQLEGMATHGQGAHPHRISPVQQHAGSVKAEA